ncbi:hypothetical protein Leryth_015982 [Lithospermum erythrorhizon]|nr:hypothetical protein Leryth_015982 [Lithospermum erythrorhizon]
MAYAVTSLFQYQRWRQFQTRNNSHLIKSLFTKTAPNKELDEGEKDVVIVGAGVAGLATAVALRRYGIQSKVLEQAETLRTEGVSISVATNGWRALDALGVGDELRNQYPEFQGLVLKTEDGRDLKSIRFKDEDSRQEGRGVERSSLVVALSKQLPPDAISFSSKLANIESQSGGILLKLQNGTQLSAKIVIACDGIHSPVARWMGFSEPKYAGYYAIQGHGVYPKGQPFEPVVYYICGRGVRLTFFPVSPTKVYWGVCFNNPSPDGKITDPSILREDALKSLQNCPRELQAIIDNTPDDSIVGSPIADRWLWPLVSPSPSKGNVVLVGDAWHPMTPNLGQGASLALEDSIVLAKKLAEALKSETSSIEDAFKAYELCATLGTILLYQSYLVFNHFINV